MAAFCTCCGAAITLKSVICSACGAPGHGMRSAQTPASFPRESAVAVEILAIDPILTGDTPAKRRCVTCAA